VAEALDRGVHDALGLARLADVGADGDAGGAGRVDLRARGLERLLPPAGEDDARAAPGELERRGPADPGPAAGDERDSAGVGVRTQGTAEGERAGGNPGSPHCRQTYKRTNLSVNRVLRLEGGVPRGKLMLGSA